MKVIYNTSSLHDKLISSNIPMPDTGEPALYNPATTYATGEKCYRETTYMIYESLVDSNTGNTPEDNTEGTTPAWLEVEALNRHKMFDKYNNTYSTYAGDMEVVVNAGRTSTVAVLGVVGDEITFTLMNMSDVVIAQQTFKLLRHTVTNLYEYFYKQFEYTNRVFWTYPISYNTKLKITVTNLSGVSKIGTLVFGLEKYLGATEVGVDLSMDSFSIKERDTFGQVYLKQGARSDECSFTIMVPGTATDLIHQFIESLDALPCVWVVDNAATSAKALQILTIYGYLRSLDTVITTKSESNKNKIRIGIIAFI